MATHRFKIGQQVRVKTGFPDQTGAGSYEIIRLMPETRDGEHHYRIKGKAGVERAVSEAQIELAG